MNKGLGLKAFLTGCLLFGTAEAVQIYTTVNKGNCEHTAKGDSVIVSLKPARPYGTYKGVVSNDSGFVTAVFPPNMNPPLSIADSIIGTIKDTSGHYTQFREKSGGSASQRTVDCYVSETPLRNYAPNVKVTDTSGAPGNMIATTYYDNAPGETITDVIPTSWGNHYANVVPNLNRLSGNATTGRAYTIRITKNGVSGYTDIHGMVESDDAGKLPARTFPESGVGIEEQAKSLVPEYSFETIGRNSFKTNYRGKLNVYNSLGQCVAKKAIIDGNFNLGFLGAGTYFLQTEENGEKNGHKVVVIK